MLLLLLSHRIGWNIEIPASAVDSQHPTSGNTNVEHAYPPLRTFEYTAVFREGTKNTSLSELHGALKRRQTPQCLTAVAPPASTHFYGIGGEA